MGMKERYVYFLYTYYSGSYYSGWILRDVYSSLNKARKHLKENGKITKVLIK